MVKEVLDNGLILTWREAAGAINEDAAWFKELKAIPIDDKMKRVYEQKKMMDQTNAMILRHGRKIFDILLTESSHVANFPDFPISLETENRRCVFCCVLKILSSYQLLDALKKKDNVKNYKHVFL